MNTEKLTFTKLINLSDSITANVMREIYKRDRTKAVKVFNKLARKKNKKVKIYA